MDKLISILNNSLQTGFVDKSILSNLDYQPELLVNKRNPPQKVLSTILNELENCSQFFISVAFVTTSGVAAIINKLKELEDSEISGKILVSQYLNFTQPEALRKLSQFKNLELRIATSGNAHAKGYIFRNKDYHNLIIGSSNLTASALCTNKEWNIKVSALDKSGIVDRVLNEFHSDFEKGTPVTEQYISWYEEVYQKQFVLNSERNISDASEKENIIPNSMQVEALTNLNELRINNKKKALIISATGTGKTYLSAFDAKAYNPKKLLFVVHRLTIATDALNTFKRVFGDKKTMGVFSGDRKELDCDFVFSTIQTISKTSNLENFSKTHFDYIIIDESHRSGAESYLRLIKYFEPTFLLGMTATPERTDGNDIFQLFDHNIAYEIRLNRAMEEDMLSTFHYYGVTDLYIDSNEIKDFEKFNQLVAKERVERIVAKAKFYGSDNGITRGLIFCSRKNEAIELSELFNLKGYRTVSLTGDSSDEMRAKSIKQLESDILSEKLDYIFTVDIFNEGIDIPKINQIILLRPTTSAIIFIQQLGRGLRKADGKSYLTVIDFIGNYDNNYLIPIALYGDTSYNKDTLRKLMTEGSRMIPGASTINFDKITKERIFQSIDSANMQLLTDLKKDYNLLKFKLGKLPMMMDFIKHGSRDPYLFVSYSDSYYNFVNKVDKEVSFVLAQEQIKLLELFAKEINNSKRVEESLIIKRLIEKDNLSIVELKQEVIEKYNYSISDETIKSCVSNLNFEFIREKKDGKLVSAKEIYNLDLLKLHNGFFVLSRTFTSYIENKVFRRFLLDSANYSIHEFGKFFESQNWREGFVLNRKYTRKDVFRILNVKENPVAQNVGGYLVNSDNSHCPIFVTYHKKEDISESTKYKDEFVNNKEFDWMSKSNRKLGSKDVQSILGNNGPIRLPLFIKKDDNVKDFYYLGEISPQKEMVEQTTMNNGNGKEISVVKIRFNLHNSVTNTIYNYLKEKESVYEIKDERQVEQVRKPIISPTPTPLALNTEVNLKNPIPLYDFHAAAGSFSEMQTEKDYTLIEGPENKNLNSDYFACEIIGESMNRVIPNGAICLFKKYTGGSRNGKIVLVENRDIQDEDFNSAFTIKTYSSEKVISEEGWHHSSITLRPNSFDDTYRNIIIDPEDAQGMRVVGEFVKIIIDTRVH